MNGIAIDSNHKYIRWKFFIHGATDGFSRTVTMINCSTDNQASTVLQHFLTATSKYGLPYCVRTDGGCENIDVWRHMIQYWGSSSLCDCKKLSSQHSYRKAVERCKKVCC